MWRIRLLAQMARAAMTGAKERLMSASGRSVRIIMVAEPAVNRTICPARMSPMLTNIRVISTSTVDLDMRLPVCSRSWNAKLRCCSLSYSMLRMRYATRWETASAM